MSLAKPGGNVAFCIITLELVRIFQLILNKIKGVVLEVGYGNAYKYFAIWNQNYSNGNNYGGGGGGGD